MASQAERNPAELIDLARYPVTEPGSDAAHRVISDARRSLGERGVAILPDFVRPGVLAEISRLAEALKPEAHLENVWGTPYLELPDESQPEGHPRRTAVHSLTWVIAYDQIPLRSPLRSLYDWDPLMRFIGEILDKRPLYRMADPLGALNLTVMEEEHVQGWHYDNADFVVSLSVQASDAGGEFECAPFIRGSGQENYDEVAKVLAGKASDRVEVLPMTPGTLMVFVGRNSIHRVSPVRGARPRHVALFAYDTTPDADSSDLFKLVRYGRSKARTPPA